MEQIISNQNSEQVAIGSIIYEPELIYDTVLKPEYFYLIEHQAIFRELVSMREKGIAIDPVTLTMELQSSGGFDIVGNMRPMSYITDLFMSIASTGSFKYHENIIIDCYRIRESQRLASEIMTVTDYESGKAKIAEMTDKILDVLEAGGGEEEDMSVREAAYQIYQEIEGGEQETVGVKTGLADYDRLTLGLHPGDLVIVGARPSMGKTAFALNVADNITSFNPLDHVAIFSLEMSKKQLLSRVISSNGRIDAHRMRRRSLQVEDWSKLTMALGSVSGRDNLHISEEYVTVNRIRSKLKKIQRDIPEGGTLTVIIDYLQLIEFDGNKNESNSNKVSEISRALKKMARELGICVVALSQLSRGVESRQDKRPMMSDLRESGAIEQDADVVTFLYRDDYYDRNSEMANIIELIVAKQRNGAVGTAEVAFIKEYGLFINLDHRYSQEEVPSA